MTDHSAAHDGPCDPALLQRLRDAYRIVAEVAQELAHSEDVPHPMRRDLHRTSSQILFALQGRPDDHHSWAEVAPAVMRRVGKRLTIPEMLLREGVDDPQRLARLLLRALDWELPG